VRNQFVGSYRKWQPNYCW